MKATLKVLAIILFLLMSDSLGIVLAYLFDNENLRLNFVSASSIISGFIIRDLWPDKKGSTK